MAEKLVYPNNPKEEACRKLVEAWDTTVPGKLQKYEVKEVYTTETTDPDFINVRILFAGTFEIIKKVDKRDPPWDAE